MKCGRCQATLKIPANLYGKTVKCRCGHAMRVPNPTKVKSSQSIKVDCPKCQRSLGVKASSTGKSVKCPCGQRIQIPKAKSVSGTTRPAQLTGDLDFSALAASTQGAEAKKSPSYLGGIDSSQNQSPVGSRTGSIEVAGKKKLKKNYASGMLSDVSTEFADRASSDISDAKRRKFLTSMSVVFTVLLVPPILFVVYRTINAASEGYENWGDRVQETVVSMKLQNADPKDRAQDFSEMTSKTSRSLPAQPTPGQELRFPKNQQFTNVEDVRITLENYYPGWVCDKVQPTVDGKGFRATMLYKPPPVKLPPTQAYGFGDKDVAIAAVSEKNLQESPDQAAEVFRETGFFSGEIECNEVNRLPGKIILQCKVTEIRDIVPAKDYPGMDQIISDLTSKTFQVTVQIDDSMTAKERQSAEDSNNQEVDYGDLADVIVEYDTDPAEKLLEKFAEQLGALRPNEILK